MRQMCVWVIGFKACCAAGDFKALEDLGDDQQMTMGLFEVGFGKGSPDYGDANPHSEQSVMAKFGPLIETVTSVHSYVYYSIVF